MLSQNQVKHITALRVKKYREEYGQFIAEGHKLVMDLLDSDFKIEGIYASADWIVNNLSTVRNKGISPYKTMTCEKENPLFETMPREKEVPLFETLPREMERISSLSTPSPVLAVVKIPDDKFEESNAINQIFKSSNLQILKSSNLQISKLILALDDIRDPGNLGTIIRIADWFGIDTVLCSKSCVDLYNSKVIQATMGSIARVKVIRCNLVETIAELKTSFRKSGGISHAALTATSEPDYQDHSLATTEVTSIPKEIGDFPVYGALLEGESLFSHTFPDNGIIIIGNESRGISPDLLPLITHKIFIPSFGDSASGKAESLNASIAAAIICAEFRRKSI